MSINPIETRYAGRRYRSRIEARWAVLFDCLGVAFEYEPDCFEVGGRRYLPDFWLRRQNLFVEVKGKDPTDEEKAKCAALARETAVETLIAIGGPQERFQIIRFAQDGEEHEGLWVIAWDKFAECGMWLVREDHASWIGPSFRAYEPAGPMFSGVLEEAYATAGGARFETLSRFFRFPVLHWSRDRSGAVANENPSSRISA